MSLSENLTDKVKKAFRYVHGSNYDKDMKSKVVNILNKTFNIDLSGYTSRIYGMAETDFNNEEYEKYINDSNEEYKDYVKSKDKEFHSAFDELKIQKVTEYWKLTYELCVKDESKEDIKKHAGIMLELYNTELNRIQNMKKELGTESGNKNINYLGAQAGLNEAGVDSEIKAYISSNNEDSSGLNTYDRELIQIISSVAKFYINHIPTYRGALKTLVSGGNIIKFENDLAIKHLTDNLTAYTEDDDDKIEYTNDKKIKLTKTLDASKQIKDAKREYKRVLIEDNKLVYQTIGEKGEIDMGYYKWKNIINEDNTYQVKTDFKEFDDVKDDCSGSIEFVINLMESDKEALFKSKISINDLMLWQKSAAKTLYNNGWICYVRNEEGKWSECIGPTLEDTIIKTDEIISKGVKFLQPGDLLLCAGNPDHGEFYVGDGYTVTYVNPLAPDKKKSGISEIAIPTSFPPVNGLKAEGTFAWGNVRDEFPVESGSGHKHYFYYDSVANCFRHCECGKEPTDSAELHKASDCLYGEREYKVIWRKK